MTNKNNFDDEVEILTPSLQPDEVDIDDSSPVVKVLRFLVITSNILVAVLVSSVVAMRYILKIDLYGVDEFILVTAFVLYFSGAAYGAHRGQHICADILANMVKKVKVRAVIVAVAAFLTLGLSVVFSWMGLNMFKWQWLNQGKTQVWRIPLWSTQGFIAICLALMSIYFLIWFIRRLKECRTAFTGREYFEPGLKKRER